jgi:hypothetical protein
MSGFLQRAAGWCDAAGTACELARERLGGKRDLGSSSEYVLTVNLRDQVTRWTRSMHAERVNKSGTATSTSLSSLDETAGFFSCRYAQMGNHPKH